MVTTGGVIYDTKYDSLMHKGGYMDYHVSYDFKNERISMEDA
jgi:hypothetical protein